ncbi:DUF1549 and DUF1553 domain-containing protein [Zavarzinella formosa]|uniref:DUF1549 and DUF1553 domain-containing protein n=1 Tax=Zavarzinella formosa TaxID=360055 RepID=UPI0003025F53|nr:DUF1549 and DUF1553 domain-containing protein [Zavarzinella formosa]
MQFRRAIIIVALLTGTTPPVFAASPEDHWAWKKPVRPAAPTLKDSSITSPIDAFVRHKLEANGLQPTPPATRPQLIRRVTFDLIGLPPTPDEVDAFVNDASPNAYEKLLDRLLASSQYGERWGRHWLDLARYADTNGYEQDEIRPHAWRFRDYVIRSFNEDKPFDRFIIEQLAGDEAFPGDPAALVATGFNLLGPDMTDSADQAQRRLNTLNDMTDTASLVFLGLTVGCARCHDHKFEPIPQTDYYRLQAFFAGAEFRTNLDVASSDEREKHLLALREYDRLTQSLRDDILAVEQPHRAKLLDAKIAKLSAEAQAAHRTPPEKRNGGQQELVRETAKLAALTDAEVEKTLSAVELARLKELRQQLKSFDSKKPAPLPVGMGMTDRQGPPPKTHLLERGELSNKAQVVDPGFPVTLTSGRKPEPAKITPSSGGRRLALANWIAHADNPLTARVIVNRVWQQHFGRGLVPTASDFGVRGEPPTHPELLDWLATELVDGGWRLKRMHKLMLLSETYRQSTIAPQTTMEKDPDNTFFSRMNRLRLEGEAVRDSLLAISGRLNSTMGGPGVTPPVAPEAVKGAKGGWIVSPDPKDHVRRSVYLFARRNLRHPFLEAFDLPDSNLSCPKRERSTTAPQALALLNAPEAMEAAKFVAERLMKEADSEPGRIDRAYRLTLGRLPTNKERERAGVFLKTSSLSELCRALMNMNEFVYLD